MSLRDQLLAHKSKATPIKLMGETYFVKQLSVGEVNHQLFEQKQDLIKFAEKAGAELPPADDKGFDTALDEFAKRYHLPRVIASRLCNEDGELLFDENNLDDLNAIAQLDAQLFTDFNKEMASALPKSLASEESSN